MHADYTEKNGSNFEVVKNVTVLLDEMSKRG